MTNNIKNLYNCPDLNQSMLQAISDAQSEFITNTAHSILFERLLGSLLSITRSEYGFIGEVLYDPDAAVYLKTHAITNIAWNGETRKFYEKNAPDGLEFRNLKTLYGAVLTSAKPVISNNPDNDPRAGVCPEGHPALKTFMGLPFFSGKEFVGMVGIANRPGGYDPELAGFMKPFLNTCGNIIQALRNDRMRMDAEKSLRESLIKNRTILETVASGIVTISEKRIIQDFNPAAERIFGYSAQEVIGRNVNVLMPEPFHSHHDIYVKTYLKTGRKKIIGIGREVMGKRKDGKVFPLELAVNEMQIGDERMFVGSLTDITLRKQIEESLTAAKKEAEKASRIKSDFINVISHELRTPLTVILGNTPLLTNPDDLPEAKVISEIAKDIEEDGQHLLALINNLLNISKIEAGKMQIFTCPVSAREMVQEVISHIRVLTGQKGLVLETQIQEMDILCDPMHLKQILLNLLGNAVKFTDRGRIVVRAFPLNNMGYFEILDTGYGISKEDIPFIFNIFHQADSSFTRRASGTGLGLTISKRFVEMHGGRIWVESTPGKGSIFTFTIPLSDEISDRSGKTEDYQERKRQ
ncbi:MAG: PAS domain S-box protein [Desulfococcaceae bacterium]